MTLFTLEINDLKDLGQERAVELFRRLLWNEGRKVGIGKNLIDAPQCVNVGDGGIDAVVKDAEPLSDEVIPEGDSGFQIKSSDLKPGECRKELHQGKDRNRPIKPEIERILDEDGTYVLVLFAEISPLQRTHREECLKDELLRLGKNPKFRLYTANQLTSFTEQFPALVTWLKGGFTECLPYSSWAERTDVRSPSKFICDSQRRECIEEIRERLRNPNEQCPVFRVIGLPGIGKTRLVFEALSTNDLRSHVIYVEADRFISSDLPTTLQNDQNLSAIIVIDECDLYQHDRFVRSFANRGPRLAVLTLSHDIGRTPPPSKLYKLKPLEEGIMEAILRAEAPQLPENVVRRLSKFADGYPRIAVLLSESYLATSDSSEDFLTVSDEALMNRLICDYFDITTDYGRRTKKVLMGLSLFRKVGYEGELSRESEWCKCQGLFPVVR